MILPEYYFILSGLMFAGGLFGVLTQRNAIRILISVEIMLNAANIAAVAFNGFYYKNSSGGWLTDGWTFVLVVIAIAAAEAAIGLAIFLSVYRNYGEITVSNIFTLQETQ